MTFEAVQQKHPALFERARSSNCPTGWLGLLDELCDRLEREFPDVRFTQIKDKFAELRIYYEGPDGANALIEEAVLRSGRMCEVCGDAAIQGTKPSGWMVTRCVRHPPTAYRSE